MESPHSVLCRQKIGWNLLSDKESNQLFFAFKKIYLKLKDHALKGHEFKIEIKEEFEDLTPLNKKLFDELRKKHNQAKKLAGIS